MRTQNGLNIPTPDPQGTAAAYEAVAAAEAAIPQLILDMVEDGEIETHELFAIQMAQGDAQALITTISELNQAQGHVLEGLIANMKA
jgi:hypothetical protein